jgi:hypothetical protein
MQSADGQTGPISIALISRRRERGKWFQKLQHALPAVVLLNAGVRGLMEGQHGFGLALSIAEIAVSALLLRELVKEFAAARRPPSAHGAHGEHHGVSWFEIFAAGVLTVEALERWHTHGHLPRPTLVMAAVTLALGLFHGRLGGRRSNRRWSLRLDEAGLRLQTRAFTRPFLASWPDIESLDLDDREARILLRDGRERRIDLTDFVNAAEVREALLAARERLTA